MHSSPNVYFSASSSKYIGIVSRPIQQVNGHEYTIKVYSDRVELYDNGTLAQTYSVSISQQTTSCWGIGSSRSLTIKDFMIKPL